MIESVMKYLLRNDASVIPKENIIKGTNRSTANVSEGQSWEFPTNNQRAKFPSKSTRRINPPKNWNHSRFVAIESFKFLSVSSIGF